MIKLVSNEQIKTIYDNKKVDFDRYNIEIRNHISTKEFSIIVDFLEKEITGDVVAHGAWYDIETDECIELLEIILKDNKPLRDFTTILENIKKGDI